MENISTLENSSSLVSITLKENKLKKDGTYYATVTRNKASFRNILSEIAEENKGIDPFILQYCAILLQKKILKFLEQGKAVNILDLGTMYIAMEVSAKSKTEVPQNGKFKVRFSPTKLTNSSLQKLSIDKIVYNDKSPEIDSVTDISTEEENVLSLGAPAKITGANLKLGSEESGIYFAAISSDEKLEDSSTWTRIDDSKVFRNKPAELNFFVPTGEVYERYTEEVRERAYSEATWRRLLREAGFETAALFGERTFAPPTETEQRWVFAAKKGKNA